MNPLEPANHLCLARKLLCFVENCVFFQCSHHPLPGVGRQGQPPLSNICWSGSNDR